MDVERRARAFVSAQRAFELPMLVLSIVLVPVIVIPLVMTLPEPMDMVFDRLSWIIWAAFAVELAVELYLAPRRLHYLRANWFNVLIVVIPFLRPLRVLGPLRALHLLRLVWVGGLMLRVSTATRQILSRHGFSYALLIGLIVLVSTAVLITELERDAGGSIKDLPSGLWWAITTVTTVGYGDTYPVTAAGRGLGAFLMVVGIALFSLLTANISAFFVETQAQQKETATLDDIMAQLRRLEEQIADLKRET